MSNEYRMPNDHNICLDDLLADAAQELRANDMHSLARAVDIARLRLDDLQRITQEPIQEEPAEQLDLPIPGKVLS